MTGELENNNNLGITEEMQQTLARMKEKLDAEDAEKKRNAERTAKYDELKKNENYSVFQKGGIDEMIQKNPAILDSDTAMQMALENSLTKVKLMEAEAKAAQPQTPTPQGNTNSPANPTGANVPSQNNNNEGDILSSTQLIEKAMGGNLSKADLEKTAKNNKNTDPFLMLHARQATENNKGGDNSVVNSIARMRAALGTK